METAYEHLNRRSLIRQLSFSALTGFTFLNIGCDANNKIKDNNIKHDFSRPLKPVLTKAGTTQKATDGIDFGFKIRSSQTNGQFSCTEEILSPKTLGVPLHKHDELDEIMHVLEGTVHVLVGDAVFEVKAGDWHLRPRGIPHAYWNQTNEPAKFNDMFLNQDFDNFLDDVLRISSELKKKNISADSKEADDLYAVLSKQYGLTNYPEKTPFLLEKYGLKMPQF